MNLITLPQKKEFLLNLVNNNYSQLTLESYARDLLVFELFLGKFGILFDDLTKLNINEYKGYLMSGQHLEDLNDIKKQGRKKNKDEELKEEIEKSKSIEEMNDNTGIVLEKALMTEVLRKSRSKGSKKRFKDNSGLNSRSINRMLSSIRSYLAFLIDLDYKIPLSPDAIKLVKTEKKESQVAELNELIKIIEAPYEYEQKENVKLRNRAILELLFSTGMRISELVNLDIEELNYDASTNKILDNKVYILGKGKKQRYVYLTERCIEHIENYLGIRDEGYPALFIPYRGQRANSDDLDEIRISQRFVQSMIKRYRKLLGVLIPTTPHSLRHGFATYLAEEGANPAAIQRLLGHESLQTTTRYVHSSDRFAERSHQDFHPLKDT